MLLVEKSVPVPSNATITVRLYHDAIAYHNIGRFRLSTTAEPAMMVKLDGSGNRVPPAVKASARDRF